MGELRILHNGDVIDSETEGDSIMLDVGSAQLSNVGPYTCQVVFTDSTSISASMGTLTVVGMNPNLWMKNMAKSGRKKGGSKLCVSVCLCC